MTKNEELQRLNQVDANTLENMINDSKKFCTSCAVMKPKIGGEIVVTTRSLWRCATCKARASIRKYESKKEKHK